MISNSHPRYAKLTVVVEFKRLIRYYGDGLPKIALPSFASVSVHVRRLLSGRRTVVVARLVVIAVIGFLAISAVITHLNSAKNSEQANYTTKAYESPQYATVLPDGKSANEFGGWRRVSPQNDAPVYAFSDTVGGVPVSVSEQPLPAAFANDPESKVADLAVKFSATNKLKAGDTFVYVGTSAKGPQSAILTKNNLLILIKSQKKISDKVWSAYAASLR